MHLSALPYPLGVFVDNAINLIPSPEWSEEQLSEYFDITMTDALSFGLTSIHDADTLPQMRKFFIRYVILVFNQSTLNIPP